MPRPVDLVAHLLLALLGEAAVELARTGRDKQTRAQVADMVAAMLDALLVR